MPGLKESQGGRVGGRGELGGPVQEGEVGGELLRIHGGCGSVLGLTVTTWVHCTLLSECTLENWFLNQGVSVKGSEIGHRGGMIMMECHWYIM